MTGTYSRLWGSAHPGCLIILLDQSGSMEDILPQSKQGAGQRKCDMVANVLNEFLADFIRDNTFTSPKGKVEIKNRADIAAIGYEGETVHSAFMGELGDEDFVTLKSLEEPAEFEKRKKLVSDTETGQTHEIPVLVPIWVKPTAGFGTPMCAALERARQLAEKWIAGHPDNYPPIVINITDGVATDGDPTVKAEELCQLKTSDGNVLLYNVHITDLDEDIKEFAANESELPDDHYAKLLFSISSPIPEKGLEQLNLYRPPSEPRIPQGARGMIFNGDANSVRNTFVLGSLPSIIAPPSPTRAPTPNRPTTVDQQR